MWLWHITHFTSSAMYYVPVTYWKPGETDIGWAHRKISISKTPPKHPLYILVGRGLWLIIISDCVKPTLSPLQRPLCVAERLRERKKKGAEHDGKGQEIERPFPSSYCPPRAFYFSIIAIFIWIPSGILCGGERSSGAFSTSLISVSTIGNTSYIL